MMISSVVVSIQLGIAIPFMTKDSTMEVENILWIALAN